MNIHDKKLEKSIKIENWFISKDILSNDWIENEKKQKKRCFKQGEIYMCELGENLGHEQSKTRPVLIVSDNRYNCDGMVNVVPLTTTIRYQNQKLPKKVPKINTHYVLRKENNDFLSNDSAVLVEHMKNTCVIRLNKYMGEISENDIAGVKNRIKKLFNL